MKEPGESRGGGLFGSTSGWILIGFLAIVGFFLITEHRAHLFGYFPLVLLLLCPLLHMFHGGHGGHDQHRAMRTPGDREHRHDREGGKP